MKMFSGDADDECRENAHECGLVPHAHASVNEVLQVDRQVRGRDRDARHEYARAHGTSLHGDAHVHDSQSNVATRQLPSTRRRAKTSMRQPLQARQSKSLLPQMEQWKNKLRSSMFQDGEGR